MSPAPARLIHFGRTMATSVARLAAADGKLLAHGGETRSIFPVSPAGGQWEHSD